MLTRPIPSATQIRPVLFALLLALGIPGGVLPIIDAASASPMARVSQMRAWGAGRRRRLMWPVRNGESRQAPQLS